MGVWHLLPSIPLQYLVLAPVDMIRRDASLALQPENNFAAAAAGVVEVSRSKEDVALGHAWSVRPDFARRVCPA